MLFRSLDTPRDALKARVKAQLNRGSFALKTDPHGKNSDVISVVFDIFQATFLQRQDNFETSLSLGGFAVRDGTTANTAYPLIVHVQEKRSQSEIVKTLPIDDKDHSIPELPDPFFFLKFERNPLDGRADSALTVRMRYMEIVYHKGYIEAVYKFLKPPASQLESVEALLVRGAFRHEGTALNFTPGRGESNAGKFAEGNQNWFGICSADAQDCRRADGFECAHHHRTRGVSNLVSEKVPVRS